MGGFYELDTGLNVPLTLSHGIFTTTLGGRYNFFSPFMDEETSSGKLRNFSKVTQRVSGRAGSGTMSDQSPTHSALLSYTKNDTNHLQGYL